VTPGDARCLARYYRSDEWPSDCESVGKGAGREAIDSTAISIGDHTAESGDTITVPVTVYSTDSLGAFGGELTYPADLLELLSIDGSGATVDWRGIGGADKGGGLIRFGGYHTEAEAAADSVAYNVLQLTFIVRSDAEGGGDLELANLVDDLDGALVYSGSFSTTDHTAPPDAFGMSPSRPNPFSDKTWIDYQVRERCHVRLEIFNILGQAIRVLVDKRQEIDFYTETWDGRNNDGQSVGSGIYFVSFKAGDFEKTGKIVFIRGVH